ncbi:DUF2023 family protein [Kiritimatiellaeota bacterium B1221]|nr:DUF2023 family protein [Kiritimatiellaeota bacterium B1221]
MKQPLDVFYHLMYEHGRGLRDLALYTIHTDQVDTVKQSLELEKVAYLFKKLDDGRVNVYFGHEACVNIVNSFGSCPHFQHTPEQDFMLGIMLGYDRTRQCERYLARKEAHQPSLPDCAKTDKVCKTCIPERDAAHTIA